MCVQRFDDSQGRCDSHYISHFATFFIDARAKRSFVESFHSVFFFDSDTKGRLWHEDARGVKSRFASTGFCKVCPSINDPSAGSPTETLLRLLLPLNDLV